MSPWRGHADPARCDFLLEFVPGVYPATPETGDDGTDGTDEKGTGDNAVLRNNHVLAARAVAALRSSGMRVAQVQMLHEGQRAFGISATVKMLLREAEKSKLRKPLKEGGELGRSAPFTVANLDDFKNSGDLEQFFSSGERIALMHGLMLQLDDFRVAMGLPETVGFEKHPLKGDVPSPRQQPLLEKQLHETFRKTPPSIIARLLPLHDPKEAEALTRNWVYTFKQQPLHDIYKYFGHEMGFYFAFLGVYTLWLVIPAVAGLGLFVHQFWSEENDDSLTFGFAIFLAIWTTVFVEYWKRKQASLAFSWDTFGYEDVEEEELPAFKARAKLVYNSVADNMEWVYPAYKHVLAYIFSASVCLSFSFFATITMLFFLDMAATAEAEWTGPQWAGLWQHAKFAPTLLYLGSMFLFSKVNMVLAEGLTELENHRTASERRSALVVKLVTLEFCNYFVALFYVAFAEMNLPKLYSNVFALLGVYQVLNQVVELGLPMSHAITSQKSLKPPTPEKVKEKARVGADDMLLADADDLFYDFLELWVQFGQVALFSLIFPLAGFLALCNNVLEIRLDAFKVLCVSKRVIPRRASGIGPWVMVFDVIGYVAVMINVALAALVLQQSNFTKYYFTSWSHTEKFMLLVAIEHFVVVLKFLLAHMVPDLSSEQLFLMRSRKKAESKNTGLEYDLKLEARQLLHEDRKRLAYSNSIEQAKKLVREELSSVESSRFRPQLQSTQSTNSSGGPEMSSRSTSSMSSVTSQTSTSSPTSTQESMLMTWLSDLDGRRQRAERAAKYYQVKADRLSSYQSGFRLGDSVQVLNIGLTLFAFGVLFTREARESA